VWDSLEPVWGSECLGGGFVVVVSVCVCECVFMFAACGRDRSRFGELSVQNVAMLFVCMFV